MPNDPFVDVAALSSLGPIRYLDARDRATFDAGHTPGAVRVPVDEWDAAAKAADVGFNKTAYWNHALGSLGVDPSAIAVTYDGGQMTNAARVWFILQYFGVKAVILNGGWPALSEAAGLPAGAGPAKGPFHAVPGAGSVLTRPPQFRDREGSSRYSVVAPLAVPRNWRPTDWPPSRY